jgi:hypothetical protein
MSHRELGSISNLEIESGEQGVSHTGSVMDLGAAPGSTMLGEHSSLRGPNLSIKPFLQVWSMDHFFGNGLGSLSEM